MSETINCIENMLQQQAASWISYGKENVSVYSFGMQKGS
jgi:hypothetical protein